MAGISVDADSPCSFEKYSGQAAGGFNVASKAGLEGARNLAECALTEGSIDPVGAKAIVKASDDLGMIGRFKNNIIPSAAKGLGR